MEFNQKDAFVYLPHHNPPEYVYTPSTTFWSIDNWMPLTTSPISESSIYEPWSKSEWDNFLSKTENVKKGEIPIMNLSKEDEPISHSHRYRVACNNTRDLLDDRILKNLSIMKSRLLMETAPALLQRVECKMTPAVKKNIIKAFRRIHMYGKKTPFIARFDEYGRRLEDEVAINTLEGMKLYIVDPDEYGELYLEFTGIVS